MIEQDIIEAIVAIGNTARVKTICEPNVSEPMELRTWMVERTLLALGMFEDEYKRLEEENNGKS